MAKLDNIDMDMMDADRLGYGVHYGHYKMDHPFTKDKNEARLATEAGKPTRVKSVYKCVCPFCGKDFTTTDKRQVFCSVSCRDKHKYAKKKNK